MRKVAVLIIVVMFTFTMQAQHVFNKGDLMFNAGIGIPYSNGLIPTVNFSGEVGVIPTGDIGLVSFGGLAEFQMGTYTYVYANTEFFPRFYAGARAAWHVHAFNSDVFDAYAGVGFGVVISGKTDLVSGSTSVNPDVFVGGRWMFSPGMGLFAEVGYTGLSAIKFGVTFGL
jgi:hypothetical protein